MGLLTPLRVLFASGLLAACGASAPSAPPVMSVLDLGAASTAPRPAMMRPGCFPERAVVFGDALRQAGQHGLSVSPTGRFRALTGGGPFGFGEPGTVIADLAADRAQVWSGVEPVMWDADDDTLVVRDRRGVLFTTTGLDQPFTRLQLPPGTPSSLLFGADGLLMFGDQNARGGATLQILDLSGEALRLTLPRPVADVGVACSRPDRCIPYAEYEVVGEKGVPRRHAVALSGGREIGFSISGRELDFVGIGPDARFAIALARRGAWRSLWIVTADGSVTPAQDVPADQDYVRAVVDEEGRVAAAETFSGRYVETGAMARSDAERQLWRITPSGLRVYQSRPAGGRSAVTWIDRSGRSAVTDFACAANQVLVGTALQTAGPMAARGAYFRPAGTPKGLVAYFPGGEYRAFAGHADLFVATLLDEGLGVVVVQARGRPGLGAAYLYDQGDSMDDRTAADAIGLLSQVIAREGLRQDLPRWAVGVSAGSRPALAALMSSGGGWSGGLILAGACVSQDDRAERLKQRRTPSYPRVADGLRSTVASCDGVVPDGRKVLVVHGLDDATASPDDMKRMVAGNPGTTRGGWLKGRGHDLPPAELVDVTRRAVADWSGLGAGASRLAPDAARSTTANGR